MNQAVDGPRARYRRQVQDEVRARAWEQISGAGVSALSLKAIATGMGMTAPALYRYYASRDELLTELILSTYRDLAEWVEAASDNAPPGGRIPAIANAFRQWAVRNPQHYLLLYGTPVPGYHAPDSATVLAQRIFTPILAAFGAATRHDSASTGESIIVRTPSEATRLDSEATARKRSVTFWTRLHGILSLELAGHFAGMDIDTEQLYQDEIRSLNGTSCDESTV